MTSAHDSRRGINLIDRYVRYQSVALEQAADALERNQWDAVSGIAHRLKGSGATFGFPAVTELATQLSAHCERANAELAHQTIQQITSALDAGHQGTAP